MKDCHVHTKISHDGISSISDYLKISNNKGIDEITFTEHYDIYDGINTDLKTLDIDYYLKEYMKYKKNSPIKINFGLEIGLQPDKFYKTNDMVIRYPFDYIIGSSHITCKKDISSDKSFFDGYTRHDAYMRYFEEVLENIKTYDIEFDVYGHLDYIVRYGEYKEKEIDYDEFKIVLDEILLNLIKKNKGLEVNTSGYRYVLGSPHPNTDIIKRYKELGGKIITIGSDAHKTNDLGSNFNEAIDILEKIGYDEVAFYHKRKPEFIKIKEFRRQWK